MLSRRATVRTFAALIASAALGRGGAASEQVVKIAIDLSLTGADAESAARMRDGAMLAFTEANARHQIPGMRFETVSFDDGTPTAGQYDPAQAATNARRMVADPQLLAAIGPQMSGAAKAMSPILSLGNLPIITPSATNPEITDPRFAAQYRPAGKPIFFRTVSTDTYQGPNLANYFAEVLHVSSVFVLDDSGAYGIGLADSFERQAERKGIKLLGRDRLDPKAADYSAVLTKVRSLNTAALYFGGVLQAGVKLAKQSYDILPQVIKAGGDGMVGPELLTAAGFPAAEGWYATIAAPHSVDDAPARNWFYRYRAAFNLPPDDFAMTAYDAGLVIIAAVQQVLGDRKPLTRAAVRDAIQDGKFDTLRGTIAFDANGDPKDHTISIFQVHRDPAYPLDDVLHQYRYVGIAPES